VGVSRSKQRCDQVPALAVEDQKRMVDVLLVIAVVVGAFLIAVGRIVRGVEIQKHLLRRSVFASLAQVELEERLGYLVARAPCGCVLQARDGGLARQIRSALRQRAQNHLEQGIFAQGV
jgi:hypothetical protein